MLERAELTVRATSICFIYPRPGFHGGTATKRVDPKSSERVPVVILSVFEQPRRIVRADKLRGLGYHPPVPLGPRLSASPLQLEHRAVGPRYLPEVRGVAAERGPQQGLVDGVVGDDEGSPLVLEGLEGADLLPGVAGPCPEISRGVPGRVKCCWCWGGTSCDVMRWYFF